MTVTIMLFSARANAHEFWIAPHSYTPAEGDPVSVDLKVGQMMSGAEYPYLSGKFRAFTATAGGTTAAVQGIEGDVPALTYEAEAAGLNILAIETLPLDISFDSFAEFIEYLDYEGLRDIGEVHRQRGLPETGITERYIRCAKSLLQVGPVLSSDFDRPIGMPFELVVAGNPYADAATAINVMLLWNSKPVAGRQIAIFRKAETVSRNIVTTDARGMASIAVEPGGEYLLNAVQMTPLENQPAMWESHWASLTFQIRK